MSELVGLLEEAGRESVKSLRQTYRRHARPRVGATLRPGPETPLWNELAKVTSARLTRRGDKTKLAHHLGIPRQRLHEYLVAKTACPDTERALNLLGWLLARNSPNRPASSKPRVP